MEQTRRLTHEHEQEATALRYIDAFPQMIASMKNVVPCILEILLRVGPMAGTLHLQLHLAGILTVLVCMSLGLQHRIAACLALAEALVGAMDAEASSVEALQVVEVGKVS
jgi:hypothetical protein